MIWQAAHFLWLLLFIPLLIVAHIGLKKYWSTKIERYFKPELLKKLYKGPSAWMTNLRFTFSLAGLTCLIIALAGPKIGTEVREVQRRGVDVMIALDLSLSMKAEDVSPSRLDKAKYEISRLLERLKGDRVGLIVFTGEAWLQSPMTTDYSALRLFLNIIDTDQMPSSTTNFAEAMSTSIRAFEAIEKESKAAKVLLIISDGEDQGEPYGDELSEVVNKGISVYTLGIGTLEGGTIPMYDENKRLIGYKRDRASGTVVVSKLQPQTLSDIADKGNGDFYQIQRGSDGLDGFIQKIDQLEKGEFARQEYADFKNQYQYLTFAALLMWLFAWLIPHATKKSYYEQTT
ncbi:VWA domain-containing protein [bacterium]|nr:MAG: VWA domain-containing protein [bacterium]